MNNLGPDREPPPACPPKPPGADPLARPACPACGGTLMEIRGKLQCTRCRVICETCCEGGRGYRGSL